MFDETIKTFLSVAKSRSLSKTAEEMYLAPNAIRKRIIRLETQTGLKLFLRSNRGVELTEAGASLLKDISVLYEQYQQAVEKAYKIQAGNNRIITVGMATTCSDTFTISSWHEIRKKLNQNPIHVAYYGNTLKDCDDLFRDVGHKIDVCIDFFDEKIAQKYGLHSKKISEFPMYIGIPDNVVITEGKAMTDGTICNRAFNIFSVVAILSILGAIIINVVSIINGMNIRVILATFNNVYRIAMVFLFTFFAYDSAKAQLKKTNLTK